MNRVPEVIRTSSCYVILTKMTAVCYDRRCLQLNRQRAAHRSYATAIPFMSARFYDDVRYCHPKDSRSDIS